MSNNVLYFSHDANAKRSPEIMRIRMKHGDIGYAIYFYILEDMRYAKDFMLATDYEALAFDNHVDSKILQSVVEDFGLFEKTEDGQYFYSESFLRRMKKVSSYSEKRSAAGRKGAAARWGDRAKKDEEKDAKEDDEDGKIMAIAYGKMANASLPSTEADSKMAKNALNKKKEDKIKLKERDTITDANASETLNNDRFEEFWNVYDKKVSKATAKKAWDKLKMTDALFEEIMIGIRNQLRYDQWSSKQYQPHASTWLNQKRWEDEIIPSKDQPKNQSNWKGSGNQGHTIASSVAAMNIDQSNRPEITIESSKADWARYQKEKEERRIAAQKWRAEQEAKKQEAANVK